MSKFQLNVVQTAAMLAVCTLISKFLGFFRELIMANYYGTGYVTDAYVMAGSIPSMLFLGIFSAVATAYMPTFSKIMEEQGMEAGNRFTSAIVNLLFFISIFAIIVGILFSNQIVSLFARGYSGERAVLTSFFVKFTFSSMLFFSSAGILTSYLEYKGKFLSPVVIGYFQNVVVIFAIVLSAHTINKLIILGPLLSSIVICLGIWLIAKRNDFKYNPTIHSGGNTRQIIALAIPVFVGSTASQIGIMVDKALASSLVEGSVSALNYGQFPVNLITGLTVSILARMIYPKLTQSAAALNYERLNGLICAGITLTIIICLPCSLGALIYSNQIIQIIYERGVFDPASTVLTDTAFFYYSIGITFNAINTLLMYTFYSMRDTKTPVAVGIIAVMIDIILNIILIKPLAHGGLALATSIGAICSTIMLYAMIRKKYPQITIIQSRKKMLKICVTAVAAIGISWLTYNYIIMPIKHILYPRMIQLGLAVMVAVVVYYLLLKVFKIEELELVKELVAKRQ